MKRAYVGFAIFLSSICLGADQEALNRALRQSVISGTTLSHIDELVREGADVNGKAPYGESALEYAIRLDRFTIALKLIKLGADPNSEDDWGLSPLLRAAGECSGSRVVDALLQAGANVNHRDFYGRTALMAAAHGDCVRSVAILLLRAKNDVEIDAQNDEMQTADSLSRDGLIPEMLEMARKYQRTGSEEVLSPLHGQM